MATAPIYVSQGMARQVGGTITELTGADISTDTVVMGLSTQPGVPPTQWVAPTSHTVGATHNIVTVLLLIASPQPPGTYWVWAKITDQLEIEPLMFAQPIRVV